MSFANHTSNALTELYAGTDFSSLSWLEQQWVAYYAYIGNPVIATGLMSFLIHEVCLRLFTSYENTRGVQRDGVHSSFGLPALVNPR